MELFAGLTIIAAVSVFTILAMLLAIGRVRKTREGTGSSGSLSRAIVEIGSMVDPGKRHVLKAIDEEAEIAEDDDEGAPPTAGL